MAKLTTVLLATLLSTTAAFAPNANVGRQCSLHMSEPESAFVADVPAAEEKTEGYDTLDVVEKMGPGAAKVRLEFYR